MLSCTPWGCSPMIISFCLYFVCFYFFSNPLLFPEEVCSHNAEVLLNAIRQKSSRLDGTRVPELWIKNYHTNAVWTSQKEIEENNPPTHGVFIFYDPKNLYLKKVRWESLDEYIWRREPHRQLGSAVGCVLALAIGFSELGGRHIYVTHQLQPEIKGPLFDLFFVTCNLKIRFQLMGNLKEIKWVEWVLSLKYKGE